MNRTIVACALSLAALIAAVSAAAQTEVDETKSARPDGRVEINNVQGSVKVLGWDRNEVRVQGKLGRGVVRLDFDVSDGRTTVRVVYPRSPRRSRPSNLTVHVPGASTVGVDTVSADISAEKVLGALRLKSVSGDQEVSDVLGALDLEAVSGDVDVSDAVGEVKIRTISGDIELHQGTADADYSDFGGLKGEALRRILVGKIKAGSVSGDIEITGKLLQDVECASVSGSIQIKGGFVRDGEAELATTSGSVKVRADNVGVQSNSISGDILIAGESLRDLECETVSGSIRAEGSFVPDAEVRVRSLSGRVEVLGGHLASVDAESKSGSLTVRGSQLAPDARLRLETYSGSISMTLPRDCSGRFDFETRSGRISNDIGPEATSVSRHGPGKKLSFTVGSNKARISAKALSGSITLRTR